MKWEPVLLMAFIIALGGWLVWAQAPAPPSATPGAELTRVQIGQAKGWLEHSSDPALGERFRFIFKDHATTPVDRATLEASLGPAITQRVLDRHENWLYRLFRVTSPAGVAWVAFGFLAQLVFTARFLVQWIISERQRQSVVPEVFWWISLVGGISLFAYFVWRQDIVGVFGQSSGIVIYLRNLRLIQKQRRRQSRGRTPDTAAPVDRAGAG